MFITDIKLIRFGVDDWSLNIIWIICDVMGGTTVKIPSIEVSLRQACVCEIILQLCVSCLMSKNKFFVIRLQEVFIESFIIVDYSVSLFEAELASRHNFLSTTSTMIVLPSSIISLILIISLSEMRRWREFTCVMIIFLSC